jgi:acyl-CoA thioesterase
VNITFLRATQAEDYLIAEAKEINLEKTTALYEIVVTEKHSQALVAKSQALVYRKRKSVF